jgi:D-sedoheptulose 7-phosphate isomerase
VNLYPFLDSPGDRAEPLAQVVASCRAKCADSIELRRQILKMPGVERAARSLARCFAAGGRLYTMGNGGSATDAHDLALHFRKPQYAQARPLPAYALSEDWATVTALANDVGYERVFSRQLSALARPGDVLLGFTTSGSSANILQAFKAAHKLGVVRMALAGSGGGSLLELDLDELFLFDSHWIPRLQEAQITLAHTLWHLVQAALSSDPF